MSGGPCRLGEVAQRPFDLLIDTFDLVPAETFYVEDNPVNLEAAAEAGFVTYLSALLRSWPKNSSAVALLSAESPQSTRVASVEIARLNHVHGGLGQSLAGF